MQCLSRSWRSPVDSQPCSTPGSYEWRSNAIATFLRVAAAVCSVSVAAAAAEPTRCEVPDHLTKSGKALCVRAASLLLPQPRLTPLQIANGPDFDAVHPD